MLYHVFTKLSSYSYVTIFHNKTMIITNKQTDILKMKIKSK